MKVIFLSHTPRDSIFKVGSTHLSRELAAMGHQVLYVPSSVSPLHLLNIPALKNADYRATLKSRLRCFKPRKDDHGVTNLTPFVLTPFSRPPFDRATIAANRSFTFNQVGAKLRRLGFGKVDLVIQDRPGLFFMRNFVETTTWIYRATDDYSAMSGGSKAEAMQQLEQQICQFADHVIVTSGPLQKKFEERYQANAAVLRNGVDVDHFSQSTQVPAEYKSLNKPIILYVGSLDRRFNRNLLLQMAQENAELAFVIVGPGSQKALSRAPSNITALGARPYEQVPAYMQHADIGILPLKLTPANHARSPMKMYEYGLCGLPVVSTPLKEIQSRNEDFVTFARTSQQFGTQINHCLNRKTKLAAIAQERSKKLSWSHIAEKLLQQTAPASNNE